MVSTGGAANQAPTAGRAMKGPSARAIMTYHSIDPSGSVISVRPEIFRAHLEALVAQNIPVVSLPKLLTLPSTAAAIAITFDDGLESVLKEAAPLLAEYGLPATLFVVSDATGRTNAWQGRPEPGIPTQRTLDWDELGDLTQQGWTIGSHTRSHPRLTRCTKAQVHDELEGSAAAIQSRLGTRPSCFAYPFGDLNSDIASAARQTYAVSCTTVHLPLDHKPAPELLPRLDAWYFRNDRALMGWGTAAWRSRIVWRHRLRRARRLFQ